MIKGLLSAKDDKDFAALVGELAQSNGALAVRAAKLQKENHYLRHANRVQSHKRLVLRAKVAADILVLLHLAGYSTGRRAAEAAGVTQDSWYAGCALLRSARLWEGSSIATEDGALIETRLRAAYERAMSNPSTVAYRIPLSKRPKSWLKK